MVLSSSGPLANRPLVIQQEWGTVPRRRPATRQAFRLRGLRRGAQPRHSLGCPTAAPPPANAAPQGQNAPNKFTRNPDGLADAATRATVRRHRTPNILSAGFNLARLLQGQLGRDTKSAHVRTTRAEQRLHPGHILTRSENRAARAARLLAMGATDCALAAARPSSSGKEQRMPPNHRRATWKNRTARAASGPRKASTMTAWQNAPERSGSGENPQSFFGA